MNEKKLQWRSGGTDWESIPKGKSLFNQQELYFAEDKDLQKFDEEIARILGFEEIPLDESEYPYEFSDIAVLENGDYIVKITHLVDVCIDMDFERVCDWAAADIETVKKLCQWWEKKVTAIYNRDKAIKAVLAAAGLDSSSVQLRIQKALKEAGLDNETIKAKCEQCLRDAGLLD